MNAPIAGHPPWENTIVQAFDYEIFVVRDKDAAHRQVKVDLDAEIAPGDTITVEESFF